MLNLNDDQSTASCVVFPGGGAKGAFQAYLLWKVYELLGLNPGNSKYIWDIIAGSSIGAILGGGLVTGKTPKYMLDMIVALAPKIFDASLIPGIGKPQATLLDKIAFLAGLEKSLYSNILLSNKLNEEFGDTKLSDIDGCTFIATGTKYSYVVEPGDIHPKYSGTNVWFSNMVDPNLTGRDFKLKDVCMASAAAPAYFTPYLIENDVYLDGGLIQNNPINFAYSMLLKKKPKATKILILCVGTGLGNTGIAREKSTSAQDAMPSNATLLWDTVSLAIGGAQEAGDLTMRNIESASGVPIYYLYLDGLLDPSMNTELDSSSDATLQYLQSEAQKVFDRNFDEINLFVQHLKS